jgi:hypothetical protein
MYLICTYYLRIQGGGEQKQSPPQRMFIFIYAYIRGDVDGATREEIRLSKLSVVSVT